MTKAQGRFTITHGQSRQMPDALPWRSGVCRHDTAPDVAPDPDIEIDLDDLTGPSDPPIKSIPRLAAEMATSADSSRFKRISDELANWDTQSLVTRIHTADDPLRVWTIHRELDRRGIEPCLRWPANTDTPQMRHITVMADLLWLATRHPDHEPAFRNWQRLFKDKPGSDTWLDRGFYLCTDSLQQNNLSRSGARALALSPAHRQLMMMFPTATMANRQRPQLEPDRFEDAVITIHSAAQANKFKPRACNPEALAHRRALLWRVFVLLDSSPDATAKAWSRLTGETVSRQSVSKQIAIVTAALKKQRALR